VGFAVFGLIVWLLGQLDVAPNAEAFGALGAAIALAIGVVGGLSYVGVIEREVPVGCLDSDGPISASVAGDPTIVYSQATALSDPKSLVLQGCQLEFTGYCIGAVHGDVSHGEDVREARWLILDDGQGLVPAGYVVGTVDPDIEPSTCLGGESPPDRPTLSTAVLDPEAGLARLSARADRAAYVGFAVSQSGDRWRRIGWDRLPGNDVDKVLPVPLGARPGMRVAAVSCIGVPRAVGRPVIRVLAAGSVQRPDILPIVRQPSYHDAAKAACDAGLPEPYQND
jgi:hypothetical protein